MTTQSKKPLENVKYYKAPSFNPKQAFVAKLEAADWNEDLY